MHKKTGARVILGDDTMGQIAAIEDKITIGVLAAVRSFADRKAGIINGTVMVFLLR